jgi:hypothetical protein
VKRQKLEEENESEEVDLERDEAEMLKELEELT